ncbi:MAG: RNA polymerase sigma factor RpoH [Gammaproteobacteria bacterium]|nr:RNA polymerase sigma factor RpoH [Gammaproteobacteria bacterium]
MATGFDTTLTVSADSLDSYYRAVSTIPVLSAEDEHALAVRYHQHGDLDAARQLVMSNLRFVAHIARGYSGYGLQQADLIQEGNVGLMKAVKRYDPNLNVRLISYAVHWIRAEIHEFILRNWRIVKVATTKAQRKLFFNLRSAKKHLGWMSDDEVGVVASELGVAEHEVLEMESRMSGHDTSFDPYSETDDDQHMAPAAYLQDISHEPSLQLEQDDWEQHTLGNLQQALQTLDPRSREILQRRWLDDDKTTLHQLAAEYQVSAERIRQLEQAAFKKLRSQMTA